MAGWKCSLCTFDNANGQETCEMCGDQRPLSSPRSAASPDYEVAEAVAQAEAAALAASEAVSREPTVEEWKQSGGRGRGGNKSNNNKGVDGGQLLRQQHQQQQQQMQSSMTSSSAAAVSQRGGEGDADGSGFVKPIRVTWTRPLTEQGMKDYFVEDAETQVVEKKLIGSDRSEQLWSVRTSAHVHIGFLLKDGAARIRAIEQRFKVRIHVNPKETLGENRRITFAGKEENILLAKAEIDKDLKTCRFRGPMEGGFYGKFVRRVREAERAAGIFPGGANSQPIGQRPMQQQQQQQQQQPPPGRMTSPFAPAETNGTRDHLGGVALNNNAITSAAAVVAGAVRRDPPVAAFGGVVPPQAPVKKYNFEWGGESLFPRVAELWELQRIHHATKTVHWKSEYEGMTWEKRKSKFEQADVIIIGIVASTDIEAMLPDVAYVIATQTGEQGEIESVFVKEKYRGEKLGKALCRSVVAKLKEMGSTSIVLGVAEGNEDVMPFYERLGFKTRWHTMKLETA